MAISQLNDGCYVLEKVGCVWLNSTITRGVPIPKPTELGKIRGYPLQKSLHLFQFSQVSLRFVPIYFWTKTWPVALKNSPLTK